MHKEPKMDFISVSKREFFFYENRPISECFIIGGFFFINLRSFLYSYKRESTSKMNFRYPCSLMVDTNLLKSQNLGTCQDGALSIKITEK